MAPPESGQAPGSPTADTKKTASAAGTASAAETTDTALTTDTTRRTDNPKSDADPSGDLDWIAGHWRELFGTTPSATSDFFTLGGTSLAAARLVSLLRKRFPHASVTDIYHYPVLKDLAERLSSTAAPESTTPKTPRAPPGRCPESPPPHRRDLTGAAVVHRRPLGDRRSAEHVPVRRVHRRRRRLDGPLAHRRHRLRGAAVDPGRILLAAGGAARSPPGCAGNVPQGRRHPPAAVDRRAVRHHRRYGPDRGHPWGSRTPGCWATRSDVTSTCTPRRPSPGSARSATDARSSPRPTCPAGGWTATRCTWAPWASAPARPWAAGPP
ncbi:acyl carrier protein [Streptomyces sp. M19]